MSVHSEPSGASPGPDDGTDHAMFPTETEDKRVSKPEKSQLVYPDPNHAQQHTVPGLDLSRKLGVSPSQLAVESSSYGNAQQPFSSDCSKLHSTFLESQQSPPDSLPEIGESGRVSHHKLHRVASSGNSHSKIRRRSLSEGATPMKDMAAVLKFENQDLLAELPELQETRHIVKPQASDDESISPIMVQQLRDRLFSLQKKLQVVESKHGKQKSRNRLLEHKIAKESEEKMKFKALYKDEKWKSEENEKRIAECKEEITRLTKVVYQLSKGDAGLSSEEWALVRSIQAEQVIKELAASPTEQGVPEPGEDLSAELDSCLLFSEEHVPPSSLGQQLQQLPISQAEGSCLETLFRHLQSLADTGKGEKKVCNVCFKEKPIDSHIITKGVMEEACGDRECRSIMIVDLERNSLIISTPTGWVEKLECAQCDRSTSLLEGAFAIRYYSYTPTSQVHKEDALLFLLYGYRVLSMRNTFQYAVKDKLASCEDLKAFMVQVWNIRRALLHKKEIDFSATNRVLFRVFTKAETDASRYRIVLTIWNVDLTDVDPGIGWCPLIYAKAHHCCWAVLLGKHKAADVEEHFLRIINRIDFQLSQERIEPQGIVRKNSFKLKV